jgi:hypothetical protein
MSDADSLVAALHNSELFNAILSDSELAATALRAVNSSKFADL